MLGYLVKWLTGRMSGRAADVRKTLALLQDMSRNAEATAHTIIAGAADQGLAAGVMADRTTLGIKARQCLGSCTSYESVSRNFTLFAISLSCADPQYGPIAQVDIDRMRDAERELDGAIRRTATETWAWRLYGHERN